MDLDGQQDAVSRLLVAILILVVEQVGIIGQLVAFQVIDHIHPQFDAVLVIKILQQIVVGCLRLLSIQLPRCIIQQSVVLKGKGGNQQTQCDA